MKFNRTENNVLNTFKYGIFMGMSLGTGVISFFLFLSTTFLTITSSREHPLAYPISQFFLFSSFLAFLTVLFFFLKNKRSIKEILWGSFFTMIFTVLFFVVDAMLLEVYYFIKGYLPDEFLKVISNIFKALTSPSKTLSLVFAIAIFGVFAISLIAIRRKDK